MKTRRNSVFTRFPKHEATPLKAIFRALKMLMKARKNLILYRKLTVKVIAQVKALS